MKLLSEKFEKFYSLATTAACSISCRCPLSMMFPILVQSCLFITIWPVILLITLLKWSLLSTLNDVIKAFVFAAVLEYALANFLSRQHKGLIEVSSTLYLKERNRIKNGLKLIHGQANKNYFTPFSVHRIKNSIAWPRVWAHKATGKLRIQLFFHFKNFDFDENSFFSNFKIWVFCLFKLGNLIFKIFTFFW